MIPFDLSFFFPNLRPGGPVDVFLEKLISLDVPLPSAIVASDLSLENYSLEDCVRMLIASVENVLNCISHSVLPSAHNLGQVVLKLVRIIGFISSCVPLLGPKLSSDLRVHSLCERVVVILSTLAFLLYLTSVLKPTLISFCSAAAEDDVQAQVCRALQGSFEILLMYGWEQLDVQSDQVRGDYF